MEQITNERTVTYSGVTVEELSDLIKKGIAFGYGIIIDTDVEKIYSNNKVLGIYTYKVIFKKDLGNKCL